MSQNPLLKYFIVTVRDKVVKSRTSGSVTVSTRGNHSTVSDTVRTNVDLEVTFEFSDGEIIPFHFINENMYTPVGQKMLLACKEGEPVAYQMQPGGEVYKLGYINFKNGFSFQEFILSIIPAGGTLMSGIMMCSDHNTYKDGKMHADNTVKLFGLIALLGAAISFYVGKGWFGYIAGTAIFGVINSIVMAFYYARENAGREVMLKDVKAVFEKMRDKF